MRRVGEGQVVQIPLDRELDVAAGAFDHCITHVVTHLRQHRLGQIAVHPRALHAAHAALQIKHARETAAAFGRVRHGAAPFELGLALCIGVAELDAAALNRHPVSIDLPQHIGRELRQGYHRVIEKPRQFHRAIVERQAGPPAQLVQVKVNRRAADARCPRPGSSSGCTRCANASRCGRRA